MAVSESEWNVDFPHSVLWVSVDKLYRKQIIKNTDVLLLASFATLPATGGYNIAWKLAPVARYDDQILII